MERTCIVVFNEMTGRVTGQIRKGEEIVKELSFYLGKLHKTEPSVVEELIRSRYNDWARVNGASGIEVQYTRD
jgi:hypothetical protein